MHSLRRTAARKLHLPGRSAGSLPEQEAEEEAAEGEYHVRVQVVELRELKVEGDTMPDPLVQVVRRGGGAEGGAGLFGAAAAHNCEEADYAWLVPQAHDIRTRQAQDTGRHGGGGAFSSDRWPRAVTP